MLKKRLMLTLFMSSLFLFSSCKGDIGVTYFHCPFASGNQEDNTLLVSTIPQDFIYKNRHYRML